MISGTTTHQPSDQRLDAEWGKSPPGDLPYSRFYSSSYEASIAPRYTVGTMFALSRNRFFGS